MDDFLLDKAMWVVWYLLKNQPWLGAIIFYVGMVRLVVPPLRDLAYKIAGYTATPKDDEMLKKVEDSKAWKMFLYLLNWLGSIKPPTKLLAVLLVASVGFMGCSKDSATVDAISSGMGKGLGVALSCKHPEVLSAKIKDLLIKNPEASKEGAIGAICKQVAPALLKGLFGMGLDKLPPEAECSGDLATMGASKLAELGCAMIPY